MLFYAREDARVWAHWNHSLDMHLSYLGPVSCFHILSFFFSGLNLGSGYSLVAARWQVFFPSWVSSGLISSPFTVAALPDDCDILCLLTWQQIFRFSQSWVGTPKQCCLSNHHFPSWKCRGKARQREVKSTRLHVAIKIKLKIHFLSAPLPWHISRAQRSHTATALDSTDMGHFHPCRKFYRTALV